MCLLYIIVALLFYSVLLKYTNVLNELINNVAR